MLSNKAYFDKFDLEVLFSSEDLKNIPENWKCTGVNTDTRNISKENLFVALSVGNNDGHDYIDAAFNNKVSAVIVNNAWYQNCHTKYKNQPIIIVDDTLTALGKLANYHRRRFNFPVIAIAGSNGKTTTKELTASALSEKYNVLKTHGNFNNQIGLPLMLFTMEDSYDLAVLEIGTNEPGEIEKLSYILEPTHGLITNIGKEHLEKLIDIDGVEIEETYLFGYLYKTGGACFINTDDKRLRKYLALIEDKVSYGIGKNHQMIKADISLNDQLNPIINFKVENRNFIVRMNTLGYASGLNAIAAASIALYFGLSDEEIKKGLEKFTPESGHGYGRMLLEKIDNITLINDTYNANPESMKDALNTLNRMNANGKKIAVLGDMRELGKNSTDEHSELLNYAIDKADFILLYGPEMNKAIKYIEKKDKIKAFDSKEVLFKEMTEILDKDDLLLIKGSRGMAMEKIIIDLKKYFEIK
jgi:UDP-N-acetylmuramoyl-tripeptide--D-alanyl-D-alanine ligase